MTVTVAAINNYIDGLRSARAQIDLFSDTVERQLGLASIRGEAVATLRQVSTTAVGLKESTLDPLRTYTADLVGGELADKSLSVLDKKAEAAATAALGAVASWVWTGIVPALVLTLAGLVAGFAGFFFNLGALVVLGGLGSFGGWALARSAQFSNEIASGIAGMWSSADALGRPTERAIDKAVTPAARALWSAAGGRAHPGPSITVKARNYARTIVLATYFALGVAAIFFLAGAYSAYNRL